MVMDVAARLALIVALLSQSGSKMMLSVDVGVPAPPPVHEAGSDDAQFVELFVFPPALPTQ